MNTNDCRKFAANYCVNRTDELVEAAPTTIEEEGPFDFSTSKNWKRYKKIKGSNGNAIRMLACQAPTMYPSDELYLVIEIEDNQGPTNYSVYWMTSCPGKSTPFKLMSKPGTLSEPWYYYIKAGDRSDWNIYITSKSCWDKEQCQQDWTAEEVYDSLDNIGASELQENAFEVDGKKSDIESYLKSVGFVPDSAFIAYMKQFV